MIITDLGHHQRRISTAMPGCQLFVWAWNRVINESIALRMTSTRPV